MDLDREIQIGGGGICEGVSAVEAVEVYVREEWAKMGASVLELVAEALKTDQDLEKIIGVDVAASGGRAGQAASGGRADMAASGSNPRKEMPKPRIKPRDEFVGLRRTSGMLSRKSRGVRIACSEKMAGGPSTSRNYSSPRLAEFNKAREALLEALRVAKAILKDARQDMPHDPAKGNDRGSERMHNNMKKRRPVRKWSLWEEVNLRNAVKEYGAGNWKLILTAYPDIFLGRTQVDLKDKWRNMTRTRRTFCEKCTKLDLVDEGV